ncbi:hypothetical protein N7512_008434 [Penicillium capsulatum]|nr:hypothetical protein N7512_008434 [Penicillium capsulatum]
MSLNGLDNPAIVDAYQSALADAGGWFLLHYVSRDEVALLERGSGGVSEVRTTIDKYNETSPLYGFLQYRRRKVILRYMPEGLSRLIQARSNVQFQSVLDKFTPNDTVLPLTQASDLNESALSSACLLHTASGSITSSSSSLRRRRLMEITEDAEETGAKEETKEKAPSPQRQPPPKAESRQRSGSQKSEATVVPPPITSPEPQEKASPDLRPPPSRSSSRPPLSRGNSSDQPPTAMSPKSTDSSSERSKYRNILDEFPRPSEEVRMSTQSARPSLRDLERAAGITPKVKLGPRPSLDQSGRPRTAGSSRNPDQRPVASMPAGMRSSSVRRPHADPPRPRSQGSSFASKPNSRAPPIPPLLVPPPSIPIARPQLSPGAKSLGALSTSSGLTPEKERLMKALQQRRKAMAKRAEESQRKQSIAEEEEPKTPGRSPQDPDENKENINSEPELTLEPKTFEPDKVHHDEESPEPPMPAPELPFEKDSSTEREIEPGELPVPVEASKPDPTTDVTVSDSEAGFSSHTSGPSADTTFSADHVDIYEALQSETPQTAPEDETPVDHGDSPIADQETKDDLVSSRATPEDPPVTKAAEISVSELQPEETEPEVASVLDKEAEVAAAPSVEPTPADVPESIPLPVTPPEESQAEPEPPVAPISVSIDPVPVEESAPEPVQKLQAPPLDQRRRIHLEPIQVPTPEYSDDDNLLSDDSFMEELRSATVLEARPVSVKSPNGGDSWQGSRAVSSPHTLPSPSAMQALTAGRSVSSSYPDNEPPTPVLMAKKINVSSGISSRIKALEKFSSREGTPTTAASPMPGPSASSSFESLRKRASVSFPNGEAPLSRHDPCPTSGNVRCTNSVSVTAHIVRDNNVTPGTEPTESDALNLQASPLTVEHESKEPQSQSPAAEPITRSENRSMSISSAGSSRQATSVSRPTSRLSLSSRSRHDENSPSSPDEKKGSRASRLMRRMSSITSTSRRSLVGALSSPVKEEEFVHARSNSVISPALSRPRLMDPIDIGEVNVQFPETLLWKRRFMRVDENGYVVLLPATNDASARNMTKRYHLTEFRTPCLPDEDMQELPNSILLDFLDGSTLQCACETRQGQATALQALVDAHTAHQP